MKFRMISLLLAVVLVLMLIPAPVSAANRDITVDERIQEQIRQTYAAAQRGSGFYSFDGFCGTMVSWQTYLLGIDTKVLAYDGNRAFDTYYRREQSSGGYMVESYPSSKYNLKNALNTITQNGTVDAYNVLVGFQWTHTAAGSRYGHAVLIHAIVDGMVYFMECFDATIDGRRYPEGKPIVCSIDTFCQYYNRWTAFDGVIHFGVKTYAELCVSYPTNIQAMVLSNTPLLSSPVDVGVQTNVEDLMQVPAGLKVRIDSLLETPGGSYWYRLNIDGVTGYVPVDRVAVSDVYYEGATLTGLSIPTVIRKGVGTVLKGTLDSRSEIAHLEILVTQRGETKPALYVTVDVNGKTANLGDKQIDRALSFRNLKVGEYDFEIRAEMSNTVLENGVLTEKMQWMTVWKSEIRIISDWTRYVTVSFNGNGGTPSQNQVPAVSGGCVSTLPTAVREGYTFIGWSLQPNGDKIVSETDTYHANTTLYAVWQENDAETDEYDGWYTENKIMFYRYEDGSIPTGWTEIDGKKHYFNAAGAAASGWMELDGAVYYLHKDGTMTTGWSNIGGKLYYFGYNGNRYSGWILRGENYYYMDKDGAAVTGWKIIGDLNCLFGDDGTLWMSVKTNGASSAYVVYNRCEADAHLPVGMQAILG